MFELRLDDRSRNFFIHVQYNMLVSLPHIQHLKRKNWWIVTTYFSGMTVIISNNNKTPFIAILALTPENSHCRDSGRGRVRHHLNFILILKSCCLFYCWIISEYKQSYSSFAWKQIDENQHHFSNSMYLCTYTYTQLQQVLIITLINQDVFEERS